MAKRKRQTDSMITTTAEGIGVALGRVASRLDAWRKQRTEIAADINTLIGHAHHMLKEISHVPAVATRGALGELNRVRKGGRPKGYKMSEATKAKLRAAWKRRRAAKAGGGGATTKKRTMSAEARERISAAQRKRWAQRRKDQA